MAQNPIGSIAERQLRQLTLRGEQIAVRLKEARAAYVAAPCDSLSKVIYELEKQNIAVRGAIDRLNVQAQLQSSPTQESAKPNEERQPVATDVADVSQTVENEQVAEPESTIVEPKEVAENTPAAEMEEAPMEVDDGGATMPETTLSEKVLEEVADAEEVLPEQTQQTNPEFIASDNLKLLFNTSRRRYGMTQQEIEQLIEEYAMLHDSIATCLNNYDNATSLQTLEKHYAAYVATVARATKIANEIADRSDLLFTSKTNSYLGFADSLGMDSLRTLHTTRSEETEQIMSQKLAGKCSDLDVALYPHRLISTVVLESELARYLEPEMADSLRLVVDNYDVTHTLFSPIGTPKRSNVKFAGVSIKKKTKERAVSSLPVLKIPSEGELYSITIANYASLPPSTKVFRGATPLYRERREDGRTYIYLGLYPTARSAQDDIALLRKAGFKQPTLVMWRDGIRRDDWVERNASSATPKTAMYRIEISGAEGALPEGVVALIREKAPRKEISKYTATDGATVYTLGIFTKEKEAQTLAAAIGKTSANISVTVVQIGKK